MKKIDWLTNTWVVAVHFLAVPALWHVEPSALVVFALMYFVTGCLGITFCFHRMLAHRAFKAHPIVEALGVLCGTLALQGTVKEWVGDHRLHHSKSDSEGDPHNSRRGFWYSHMTWLFIDHRVGQESLFERLTRDISTPMLKAFSRHDVMIGLQILLGLLFLQLGGESWLYWGVFARLVAVYHTTWFVNSATHKWGYRTFDSHDASRNNWWVALLTWGEGWHNNHHRFASVAPARFRWWEIDVTFMIIWTLERFGLVYDVKRYPPEAYIEAQSALTSKNPAPSSQVEELIDSASSRPAAGC
ncbi:MAG: acyl-CoA desaturase [Zetaproteobacteria bacterium]|nr:acyl-CoA desaturase [Zetaproteobacteria bacterium]